MARVYFFQKRNPVTGEVLADNYVDADELTASRYIKIPRSFKYVGWSDGRFVKPLQKRKTVDKETKMQAEESEEWTEQLREAVKQELEFAKTNPDKTPPRDFSRIDFNTGKPISATDIATGNLSRRDHY